MNTKVISARFLLVSLISVKENFTLIKLTSKNLADITFVFMMIVKLGKMFFITIQKLFLFLRKSKFAILDIQIS